MLGLEEVYIELIILIIFILTIITIILQIRLYSKYKNLKNKIRKKNDLHDKIIRKLKKNIRELEKKSENYKNKKPKAENKANLNKNKDSVPEKNEIKSNDNDMEGDKTKKKNNKDIDLEAKQNDEFSNPQRSSESHKIFCEFVNLKKGVDFKKSGEQTEWYMKKINTDEKVYKLYHVGNLKNSESWYRIYTKMFNTPESGMEQGKKILIDHQPKYKLGENNNYRLIEKGSIKFN